MSENKAKKTSASKKSSGTAAKKISISFDKEFYFELESYVHSHGYGMEDYIKKAVKEKFDSDRISTMIDIISSKK